MRKTFCLTDMSGINNLVIEFKSISDILKNEAWNSITCKTLKSVRLLWKIETAHKGNFNKS